MNQDFYYRLIGEMVVSHRQQSMQMEDQYMRVIEDLKSQLKDKDEMIKNITEELNAKAKK